MVSKKYLSIVLLFYCYTFTIHCAKAQPGKSLQAGDLLFQDLNCGDLCDAIEAVTEGVDGKDFSHCGMVVNVNGTLKVVEAIGEGVQINSLKDFYARSGNAADRVLVGRVKEVYQNLLEDAIGFAIEQVGLAYDDAFLLYNGKWYCSELLFESFRKANGGKDFFDLKPMTFRDPNTDAFFPAWVDYFADLGKPIPEGQPGLNPGSISLSEKIEIIAITIQP